MLDPTSSDGFRSLLRGPTPLLALAPMQDVTDHAFMRVTHGYGAPDFYVTEYFRAHSASTLRRSVLRCIVENPTHRPVVAQLAGRDVPALARMARDLQAHPIAAVDLNLGCPAPIVCRKRAGGGLLRELPLVDEILRSLREVTTTPLTVKTRLGFADPSEFDAILELLARHPLDMVAIHGRTVRQLYGGVVDYGRIAQAARRLPFPVIANGDIDTVDKALAVLRRTGARGLMVGRGAIRNPWIFGQIRQALRAETIQYPTGREVGSYLHELYEATSPAGISARDRIDKFKKYLNFIGQGLPNTNEFLYEARRMQGEGDLRALTRKHLEHDAPLRLERSNGLAPADALTVACSA